MILHGLASPLLCFSSKVSATVIAEANLFWEFNVPVSFEYGSGPLEIGAIYEFTDDGLVVTRATLDALGFARVDVGESFVDARFDVSDGTASARVQSVDPAPGSFSQWSAADAVYRIFAFTDVLTFSYSYDFQGTKENADDWMNFFVQTAVYDLVNNSREVLYTDYDPSHPSYQTNWPGDNRSLDLSQNISGTIDFSFGEPGVFRNWEINTDLILNARDSAGASVAVAEPSTLSLALFGVLVFLRRSFKQFGRPSADSPPRINRSLFLRFGALSLLLSAVCCCDYQFAMHTLTATIDHHWQSDHSGTILALNF